MSSKLIVIGAGGHAASLLSAWELSLGYPIIGAFVGAMSGEQSNLPSAYRSQLLDSVAEALHFAETHVVINGIGVSIGAEPRHRVMEEALKIGFKSEGFLSRQAVISKHADLERDLQVFPGAHIGPRSRVSAGCVMNTASILEHDSSLGLGCFLGPGAIVLGGARLGDFCEVGASATILPGVEIGSNSIIGAGAVVTESFPSNSVLVGVPARSIGG